MTAARAGMGGVGLVVVLARPASRRATCADMVASTVGARAATGGWRPGGSWTGTRAIGAVGGSRRRWAAGALPPLGGVRATAAQPVSGSSGGRHEHPSDPKPGYGPRNSTSDLGQAR